MSMLDITIEAGGKQLAGWNEIDLDSDLFVPCDDFRVTRPGPSAEDLAALKILSSCVVKAYGVPVLTGVIDEVETTTSRQGGTICTVQGRSVASHLVDSCIDPPVNLLGRSLKSVAEEICGRWNILVNAPGKAAAQTLKVKLPDDLGDFDSVSAEVNAPVKTVKSDPEDRAWDLIDRLALDLGVYVWLAPDGSLRLFSPDMNRAPRYTFIKMDADPSKNNVETITARRSASGRYSQIKVFGQSPESDEAFGPAAQQLWSKAVDADLGIDRPLVLSDSDATTTAMCKKRAERELAIRKNHQLVVELSVFGWSQNGVLYSPDQLARVKYERAGIDEDMYVIHRRFVKTKQRGVTTDLTLIKKGRLV